MKTIWKFKVSTSTDYFTMNMPMGATILSLQMQNGEPYVWALIPDTNAAFVSRLFRVLGTGEVIHTEKNLQYIGTFQFPPYVWHLFEEACYENYSS